MLPEIFWIAGIGEHRLAVMPRPRAGDWLVDEVRGWRAMGVNHIVCLLQSAEARELGLSHEAELCSTHDLRFTGFPIPDRGVPSSLHQTTALIGAIEANLRAGQSVAIHCRAGIGRSALVAACVLVNLGLTASQALARVQQARGLPVPDTPEQAAWVAQYERARKDTA